MSGEPDLRHASLLVHVDGGLDLPIDVLDSEMRLALQGYSNEPLSVTPGAYLVSATLPGGATAMKLVGVGAGDNLTVNLPVRHEFSRTAGPASLGRLTGLDEPVRTVAEALDLDMTTPRFWRMDNLEIALEDPNPVVEASPSEGGRRIFRVTVPGPGVYYAQVDTPDGAQLNVALPATATLSSTCELLLQLESSNILLGAFPAGLLANLASKYLAFSQLSQGLRIINSRQAKEAIILKQVDPIGACVGGYLLLRAGGLDPDQDWPYSLAQKFESLPDAAVIAAEHAALRGDHSLAVQYYLMLEQRGLPIFTEGYSFAISRLRQYRLGQLEASGAVLSQEDGTAAVRLLRRLAEWSSFVDFGALTLTFRAPSPAHPRREHNPQVLVTKSTVRESTSRVHTVRLPQFQYASTGLSGLRRLLEQDPGHTFTLEWLADRRVAVSSHADLGEWAGHLRLETIAALVPESQAEEPTLPIPAGREI